MNKWIIVLLGLAAAVIAVMLYFFITKKQLVVQASLGQSQTVTLSNSNPSQSVTINIPYNDTIGITVSISGGQPYSSYDITINSSHFVSIGGQRYIDTNGQGSGSTNISISSLYSSVTITVTITGPGIPSSYVLTLNVNLAYNPVLTVNVNGTTYTLTNSSSDAQSHVTGTSIPVSFSLSNAVPNSSYTVQKQIQYRTSSGVLLGPSTQFTVTTDSSGNASWSDTINPSTSYNSTIVDYQVSGIGIGTYFLMAVIASP